ncbi:MAG: quinone-dependent dihydroorotate dehydrogenase [Ferruginibacter sp.]
MYAIFRPLFFRFEPERAHALAMGCFRILLRIPVIGFLIRRYAQANTHSPKTCVGLTFRNGIGLGAGFDKNARYLSELQALGFGFVEIGTVTPRPQEGNPKPRLFRLPSDQALINRMGFNNDGAAIIAARLSAWRQHNPHTTLIIGGNIGKNKNTPAEEAATDYRYCLEALHPFVDYFVVNVSSPNTPGLRDLQEKEALRTIFNTLRQSPSHLSGPKPILLKIAPDLAREQVLDILSLWENNTYDGLIVSNTTIDRHGLTTNQDTLEQIGTGGLSGKPLRTKSTDLISFIHQLQPSIPIIGSGGIFTGADVTEKQQAGASLVQLWTGFIYEGPFIVRNIFAYLNKHHGTSFDGG